MDYSDFYDMVVKPKTMQMCHIPDARISMDSGSRVFGDIADVWKEDLSELDSVGHLIAALELFDELNYHFYRGENKSVFSSGCMIRYIRSLQEKDYESDEARFWLLKHITSCCNLRKRVVELLDLEPMLERIYEEHYVDDVK